MANIDWQNLKDWAREEYRLKMANSAGVDLDEIVLPGDENPDLNIVLRLQREADVNDAIAEAEAEAYADYDDLPSHEDIMLFDALDGSIDGSFDVL